MREQKVLKICENFPIGIEDAELSFAARLCREQVGWTLEFSKRVIFEYRRFIYLLLVCDKAVTPSNEVDQAWHLHLLYTRNYQSMCETLEVPFIHHGPTAGGEKENQRYLENYQYTLKEYRRLFGESPPEDIWPPPAVRFDPRDMGVWSKRSEFVVVKRSIIVNTVNFLFKGMLAALIIFIFTSLGGCAGENADSETSTLLVILFVCIGAIILLTVIGLLSGRKSKGRRRGNSWLSDLGESIADILDSSDDSGGGSGCSSSGCGGSGCGGGGCS